MQCNTLIPDCIYRCVLFSSFTRYLHLFIESFLCHRPNIFHRNSPMDAKIFLYKCKHVYTHIFTQHIRAKFLYSNYSSILNQLISSKLNFPLHAVAGFFTFVIPSPIRHDNAAKMEQKRKGAGAIAFPICLYPLE